MVLKSKDPYSVHHKESNAIHHARVGHLMGASSETVEPYLHYKTSNGRAWCGDSRDLLPSISDNSINLICTSPPFALTRKKAYGNKHQGDYIEWFMEFAGHFQTDLGFRRQPRC